MEIYPVLIGGKTRETKETADVRFPYTGEVYARVYQAGPSDLEDAMVAAVKGFEKMRKLSASERSKILEGLADEIRRRADYLVDAMVMEGGKTRKFATSEVARAEMTVRISAEEARRIYGEILPLDWTDDTKHRTGYLMRFPVGPVLGIVPFNFPLNLACHKLAPAIAAGNSIILKPASSTPISSLLLGEMALSAGAPPEAINVVPCPGERAEIMVRDPRVAFLSFTGSCSVGWHLKEIAGRKRVGLELGGNAAVIVHEDANLDIAASRIATGGFINAGQVCISVQRVLIHRTVYEETVAKILAATSLLKVGDPRDPATDIGPMIDPVKAGDAYKKVAEAVSMGAQVLIGGSYEGRLFTPTVLARTTPDMRVNSEEVFAPVISVTPYDEFDEALRIANDSDFGLQVGIFTQNINRVMRAFEEMNVGGVIVNDIPSFRVDHMPYGGVRGSGTGREGPRYAIEEMTEPRLLVINRDGGIG
jgi:acyl-CoA reductase-like NAD-dependent aldehyde dehydrogenase